MMSTFSSDSGSIEDAFRFLSQSPGDKSKKTSCLYESVQVVESIARKHGISESQLVSLVDLSCCGKYADVVATKLIKSLIPSGKVPSLAVVKAISWICTNKLSINLQALMLRWIVVVYKLIDDISSLHSLYGILFLFLESDVLCPHVCVLLSHLTVKEDVKHFRIKKLLNLQNRVGTQPHLTGLLAVYKMYYPNLVAMATSSRKVWFKQRDKAWSDIIWQVQEKQSSMAPVSRLFLDARGLYQKSGHMPKRRRVGSATIPSPQSSTAVTTNDSQDGVTVPIQQLGSFADLLKHIDNVELPNQIASVLESPLLQHVISCTPSYVTLQRLNFWLNHSLSEEFLVSEYDGTDPTHTRLLQMLIQLTEFLQESVPAVETWLVRYLFSWNGVHHRPLILKLVTQLGLYPFTKLHDLVLEPLRKLFFSSSVYFKCQVMYCFTELLRNLASIELTRHNQLHRQDDNATSKSSTSIFVDEESPIFDPLVTIYEFTKFVDKICVVALQAEEDHALLQHHVLNLFELVSVLHTGYQIPFVAIPSPAIVYRLLFASNAMACSRLCQVIVNCKNSYESLKAQLNRRQLSIPDGFQNIQTFNQYILDACNSLWRSKAFMDKTNSGCFDIPSSLTDEFDVRHVNEGFAIYSHVALVGFAWKFLKETQPEDIALNPRLIKGHVRQVYMEYLRRQGLLGICVFLETFIRHKS